MQGDSIIKKVLVCLDGSNLAEQILPYATDIALRCGSKVILLQVVDMPGAIYTPGEVTVKRGWKERIQKETIEAEVYLDRVALQLQEKGLKVETVALEGIGDETIVSYAQENEIDLIAITTHARKNIGRLVFGSVADTILKKSGLPTLAIRPIDTKE